MHLNAIKFNAHTHVSQTNNIRKLPSKSNTD